MSHQKQVCSGRRGEYIAGSLRSRFRLRSFPFAATLKPEAGASRGKETHRGGSSRATFGCREPDGEPAGARDRDVNYGRTLPGHRRGVVVLTAGAGDTAAAAVVGGLPLLPDYSPAPGAGAMVAA